MMSYVQNQKELQNKIKTMKSVIILIISLLPLISYGQLSLHQEIMLHQVVPEQTIELHLKDTKSILGHGADGGTGVIMMTTGAAFILAGTLTRPERTLKDGEWVNKSFFNQGPRSWAILTGVGVFCGGIVWEIGN